ncbi:hypothetical protein PVMG_05357 [Plasmodium vivax Mauritania I]|uniref:Uncharacterized protein n=1 Tax=Plasmodium vivax Mauritania I TaxID=1035515 RepID=A0A0J9W5L3_PLAVI|nr:hypothetical protein PVMG_05357 [Plasmodium vivax Mauritania I]
MIIKTKIKIFKKKKKFLYSNNVNQFMISYVHISIIFYKPYNIFILVNIYLYPFLEKIWISYEEFNQTVDESDENKANYVPMCEQIMQKVHDKQEWYNDLCIKLIRNLGAFYFIKNKAIYNTERCKNLNSWLYYIIKDYNMPQHVSTNIFNESNKIIGEADKKHYCTNYLYKDIYNNPDDIIKLINLEEYMNELLSVLKNKNDNNHCLCRKFIFECAKIYRDMNKIYCASQTVNISTKFQTCFQLELFKSFFTSYISTIGELKGKLPSLYSEENELIPKCSSDIGNQEPKLDSTGVDQSISPKKISISTAVGTMAGIPPFLALISKVNMIYI